MALAFARPEGQGRQGLLVKIKNHAHKVRLSTATLTRISGLATVEDLGKETAMTDLPHQAQKRILLT